MEPFFPTNIGIGQLFLFSSFQPFMQQHCPVFIFFLSSILLLLGCSLPLSKHLELHFLLRTTIHDSPHTYLPGYLLHFSCTPSHIPHFSLTQLDSTKNQAMSVLGSLKRKLSRASTALESRESSVTAEVKSKRVAQTCRVHGRSSPKASVRRMIPTTRVPEPNPFHLQS
jgi:hypothetical protein